MKRISLNLGNYNNLQYHIFTQIVYLGTVTAKYDTLEGSIFAYYHFFHKIFELSFFFLFFPVVAIPYFGLLSCLGNFLRTY